MDTTINNHPIVLLVDDEQDALDTFSLILRAEGLEGVETLSDSREVMPSLEVRDTALVVLDLNMPHMSGLELLTKISEDHPGIPVIILTAANDIDTAVKCMQNGAVDYLVKPVEKARFVSAVRKSMKIRQLRNEAAQLAEALLNDSLKHPGVFSSIITRNRKMIDIFRYVEAIACSQHPVLVTGETGVGKELIAKALHTVSGRKGEFVAINVAGLDDAMFSDALFGHERGAFTGADSRRGGMIAQAVNGTLFLDEMGDLCEASQVKLLRLLQEGVYYPLGSDVPRKSSARIVAATNKDMKQALQNKKIRKDLYYRICGHHIQVPPLRERQEDISLLVDRFLADAAASLSKKKPTPPPELASFLVTYPFPGNIRELQEMVFDAVARHTSGVLSLRLFKEIAGKLSPLTYEPASGPKGTIDPGPSQHHFPTLKQVQDHYVKEALRLSGGNKNTAASLLGISRQALYKKLKNGLLDQQRKDE
jgi:DNA-binding NtrC family response regulator